MHKEINVGPKNYSVVVNDANAVGFQQIFVDKIYPKRSHCGRCGKYEALVFRAEKEALTPYHTAVACPCGWRKFYGYDTKKSSNTGASVKPPKKPIKFKPVCSAEGCRAVLKSVDENNGFCYKCKPAAVPTNVPTRPVKGICKGKDCSNPLPPDRKSFCYACRPKTQAQPDKEVAPNQSAKIYV